MLRTHRAPRFSRLALAGILGLFGLSVVASAHDFWIVPLGFDVSPGQTLEVVGQTSTKFPTSLSAVTPERVAEARLLSASADERISDLTVSGKSLLLRQRPSQAGQYVVAVGLVPRISRALPSGLKRYVALEGAPELAERYDREGRFAGSDSLTQKTTKYAKTVVTVGRGGAAAFSRVVGHALELVPLSDPALLRVGDTLGVKLLFRTRPLAGAHLHAGAAPEAAVRDSSALPADWKDVSVTTGEDGVARILIDRAGLWNVRSLHAAPSADREWEVAFATLVVRVLPAANSPRASQPLESRGEVVIGSQGTQADSAAVASTVTRFHAAIAAGDTTGAMAFLTDDVVVLESGDIETREEFRAHHLAADMAYAGAVKIERGPIRVIVRGDVAWATSTTTASGDFRGRAVNSAGAELAVLTRTPLGWRISAVHWSSRTRRPAGD